MLNDRTKLGAYLPSKTFQHVLPLPPQVRQSQRDTLWSSYTNLLGFPVMGIWPDCSDGTDINALCRSYSHPQFAEADPLRGEGQYVATVGDDGRLRLFAFPCVVDMPKQENARCAAAGA